MDLAHRLTEIEFAEIFSFGFADDVVKYVYGWQLAESQEMRLRFYEFTNRRCDVNLAIVHLENLVENIIAHQIEGVNRVKILGRLMEDVGVLIFGLFHSFDGFDYGSILEAKKHHNFQHFQNLNR